MVEIMNVNGFMSELACLHRLLYVTDKAKSDGRVNLLFYLYTNILYTIYCTLDYRVSLTSIMIRTLKIIIYLFISRYIIGDSFNSAKIYMQISYS